jgi:hypothetical protein
MRTKTVEKSANKKKINWALPNQTVTHDDFTNAIKESEKGPFYTVQESMQHFEQWLESRKKQ